ncbi:ABC transporter permease [Paenibacillus sp. IITD108]|uniref:ABC transporter permease n=1 Tax=Paenibacillus sp. IITD108 TaxID=3116649 RepID=UPI002F422935
MSQSTVLAESNPDSARLKRKQEQSKGFYSRAWRKFRRNRLAVIGLIFVFLFVAVGIVGPWIAPYPYDFNNYEITYQTPVKGHPFGTDELGRDVFSRLIYSLHNAVLIAFGAIAIELVVGGLIGSIAAYVGGRLDNILMRIVDIFFAFPVLLINIILLVIMGRGLITMLIAIGLTSWVGMAWISRGAVVAIREKDFVEAARALGATNWQIIRRYIAPNAVAPIIVQLAFGIPSAMMIESSLSAIGMGFAPPIPSWGNLITSGQKFMWSFPHLLIWPMITFVLVLLAFTFVGDGVRDALDPKE